MDLSNAELYVVKASMVKHKNLKLDLRLMVSFVSFVSDNWSKILW